MSRPTILTYPNMKDAKKPFVFTVKPNDVRGSVVGDPENCAGACALRALPEVKKAWVMRTRTFLLFEDGSVFRYWTPKKLQKIVEGFDNTAGLFPPGDYVLPGLSPSCTVSPAHDQHRSLS